MALNPLPGEALTLQRLYIEIVAYGCDALGIVASARNSDDLLGRRSFLSSLTRGLTS